MKKLNFLDDKEWHGQVTRDVFMKSNQRKATKLENQEN